jgi:hypothetical protein
MRTAANGAQALRAALQAEGGPLAGALDGCPVGAPGRPGPAQVAAAGPRASGFESEYELLVEMILEGSRLHYGSASVLACRDPDLALLLGDQLYALGLARLAVLGDLAAIAELADVISLIAQAHAGADAELAEAVWEAGVVAIGWGRSCDHESAKELARAGDPEAAAALRSVAASVQKRR